MEKFNRAVRRHHRARLKAKRKSYWGGNAASTPTAQGAVTRTPQVCSCVGCGNPRWIWGRSISELRMYQDLGDETDEPTNASPDDGSAPEL